MTLLNHWTDIFSDQPFLLATISLLTIFLTLWFKHTLSVPGAPPLPPGPVSVPILGFLPFLTPDLHTQFTDMARTYGPIFKFYLGSKLHVVINSPELAKVIVRDQDEAFSNRDQSVATLAVSYGGKDIVFSNNNADWRNLRKILVHEVLSNKNLKATSCFRREAVRYTVKDIFGRISTAVNIREMVFRTETNVLARMVWENATDENMKDGNLGAEIDKVASNMVKIFGRVNLSDFFPSLARFDVQRVDRDMTAQRDKLDKLFTKIIEDRMESNLKRSEDEIGKNGKKDFVQILLELKDQRDVTLSITQIKALLLDVLIAGTETTATTVEWAMTRILHNHKVMKMIQEELVEIVGLNNMVEESHLPKLKYLDATIKETLRMYPTVPFLIPRSPSEACIVGGYTIPKGCTVFLNLWSIHRDPRYWDNPSEFNPERFLTDKWDFNGTNLVFFPFGSGRRLCAGIPLAEKMLMFILALLLHSFDWSLPSGEEHDLTEAFGIALKKRKPLIAIPSQRLSHVSLYI